MAENLIERRLRWASRPTHFIYLGDVAKAAEWKQFALKKKYQLLDIGNGSPLSHHLEPNGDTKISYRSNGLVDTIIIEVQTGGHYLVTEGELWADKFSIKYEKNKLSRKLPYTLSHIKNIDGQEILGGNIDWYSLNELGNIKELLSWTGPLRRNCIPFWDGKYFAANFSNAVYRNGKIYAMSPSGTRVLGAAFFGKFLVIATEELTVGFSIRYVAKKDITANGSGIPWITAKQFDVETDGEFAPLAAVHLVAFSESASKFATVWMFQKGTGYNSKFYSKVFEGTISGGDNSITAECSIPAMQSTGEALFEGSYSDAYSSSIEYSSVISVDYKKETLIKLTKEISLTKQGSYSSSSTSVKGDYVPIPGIPWASKVQITNSASASGSSNINMRIRIQSSDGEINESFQRTETHSSSADRTDSALWTYTGEDSGGVMGYNPYSIWADDFGTISGSATELYVTEYSGDVFNSILYCDLRNDLVVIAYRHENSFISVSATGTAFVPPADYIVVVEIEIPTTSTYTENHDVTAIYKDATIGVDINSRPVPNNEPMGNITGFDEPYHELGPIYPMVQSASKIDRVTGYFNRTGIQKKIFGVMRSAATVANSQSEFRTFAYLSDENPLTLWTNHLNASHEGIDVGLSTQNEYLKPVFWI